VTGEKARDFKMNRNELEDFRGQCERNLERSVADRMRYGFNYVYKPVLDDADWRSFDTMEEYRRWCRENLCGASWSATRWLCWAWFETSPFETFPDFCSVVTLERVRSLFTEAGRCFVDIFIFSQGLKTFTCSTRRNIAHIQRPEFLMSALYRINRHTALYSRGR